MFHCRRAGRAAIKAVDATAMVETLLSAANVTVSALSSEIRQAAAALVEVTVRCTQGAP